MSSEQGAFDFAAPAVSGLTCAFGEPWGPGTAHPLCDAETERAYQAFDAAVARGEFCPHGYTPKEAKRLKHRC